MCSLKIRGGGGGGGLSPELVVFVIIVGGFSGAVSLIAFLVLILQKFGNDLKVLIPGEVELKPTSSSSSSSSALPRRRAAAELEDERPVAVASPVHSLETRNEWVGHRLFDSSQFKSCLSLFVIGSPC